MKTAIGRRQDALMRCAPISETIDEDRAMRAALQRARDNAAAGPELARQHRFDRAVAALVKSIPVAPEIGDWFASEGLVAGQKRSWLRLLREPAVLAIGLALAVLAGVLVLTFLEHAHDFPGAVTAKKLLLVASSTRSVLLDPVQTEAGELGDLFFMKHRLEHYDVPPEFSEFRTVGCRVFDDDDAHRVAQIWVVEKRMQLFLFPGEKNDKGETAADFTDWRYVEQEGWTGVVTQRNGVCFMAAVRGPKEEIAPYVSKQK
jgi:hypothetical protein